MRFSVIENPLRAELYEQDGTLIGSCEIPDKTLGSVRSALESIKAEHERMSNQLEEES